MLKRDFYKDLSSNFAKASKILFLKLKYKVFKIVPQEFDLLLDLGVINVKEYVILIFIFNNIRDTTTTQLRKKLNCNSQSLKKNLYKLCRLKLLSLSQDDRFEFIYFYIHPEFFLKDYKSFDKAFMKQINAEKVDLMSVLLEKELIKNTYKIYKGLYNEKK